jgi:hypothetical protein
MRGSAREAHPEALPCKEEDGPRSLPLARTTAPRHVLRAAAAALLVAYCAGRRSDSISLSCGALILRAPKDGPS